MRRTMLALLSLALGACGSAKEQEPAGALRVTDAWVRVTNVTGAGAAYMTIENRDTAVVFLARVSSSSARAAELHQTMQMEGSADGSMAGMVHMTHLDSLAIAKGNSVALSPGGTHIMLTDLVRAFAPGDTIPLQLTLTDGRTTDVRAIVREQQP